MSLSRPWCSAAGSCAVWPGRNVCRKIPNSTPSPISTARRADPRPGDLPRGGRGAASTAPRRMLSGVGRPPPRPRRGADGRNHAAPARRGDTGVVARDAHPDDAAVAALYAGPVESFVERRSARVKELKAAKDRQGAGRVAALRRPTLGAWALDQVAHDEPDRIERLLAVGAQLRDALEAAVRGDAGALRTAQAEQRAAVDDVVGAAMDVLAAGGHAGSDTALR